MSVQAERAVLGVEPFRATVAQFANRAVHATVAQFANRPVRATRRTIPFLHSLAARVAR